VPSAMATRMFPVACSSKNSREPSGVQAMLTGSSAIRNRWSVTVWAAAGVIVSEPSRTASVSDAA
jgi:hypothetical protein